MKMLMIARAVGAHELACWEEATVLQCEQCTQSLQSVITCGVLALLNNLHHFPKVEDCPFVWMLNGVSLGWVHRTPWVNTY